MRVESSKEILAFLDFLSSIKRLSSKTTEAYQSDLNWWVHCGLDLKQTEAPTEAELLAALKILKDSEFETSTQGRRRSSLRSYANYKNISSASWIRVLELVPGSQASDDLPKALDQEQIKSLLDFDPKQNIEKIRNRTLLELLYASGLRISEALGLSWEDLDMQQNLIRVWGKGSKERVIPFSARAAHWLEQLRENITEWRDKSPTQYKQRVFLSSWGRPLSRMGAWKILHRRGLECGIDDLHPHVLRHSLATHLLQGGADVRMVQAFLGHSSLNTTAKYLKISDGELQTLFAEIHPLR
jgi:integrase/recombinase XerD